MNDLKKETIEDRILTMEFIESVANGGVGMITTERQKQFNKHKRSIHSDVLHNPNGELIQAARALMKPTPVLHDFPESWGIAACRKMINKSLIERYAIAGALISAEIDRYDFIEKIKKDRIERKKHAHAYHPLTPSEAIKLSENA